LLPLYVSLLVLTFLSGFLLARNASPPWTSAPTSRGDAVKVNAGYADAPLPPLAEAWVLTERQFYGAVPTEEERLRGAVRGLLETLGDPYTVLLDPHPAQQEQQRLSGRYGDAGLALWWTLDGHIGVTPFPDSPAEDAGVQQGDYLLRVDGELVTNTQDLDAVAWELQGEVGTTVTLSLLRPPTPAFTLTVERDEVLHPSIQWRMLDVASGIGYLQITLFTDQTAQEVDKAIAALKDQGAQALILDLRGNGGGVVAPLPRTLGIFMSQGTVVYYEIRQRDERPVRARGPRVFEGPLAVLVDSGTASASEIFVAALQEQGRATIVGQPTFGKGSIQALYNLQDGSTLHLTNAVWLTPQRQRLDGVGVHPDLLVDPQPGQDAELDAAVMYLR
jgi:carboxyl-terminal processing protease